MASPVASMLVRQNLLILNRREICRFLFPSSGKVL
jgi:hypothetical protein